MSWNLTGGEEPRTEEDRVFVDYGQYAAGAKRPLYIWNAVASLTFENSRANSHRRLPRAERWCGSDTFDRYGRHERL